MASDKSKNQTSNFEFFSVNLSMIIKTKIGHCVAAWPLPASRVKSENKVESILKINYICIKQIIGS